MINSFIGKSLTRHLDDEIILEVVGVASNYLDDLTLTGAFSISGKTTLQFRHKTAGNRLAVVLESSAGSREAWLELGAADSLVFKDDKGATAKADISDSAFGLTEAVRNAVKRRERQEVLDESLEPSEKAISEDMRRRAGFVK